MSALQAGSIIALFVKSLKLSIIDELQARGKGFAVAVLVWHEPHAASDKGEFLAMLVERRQ